MNLLKDIELTKVMTIWIQSNSLQYRSSMIIYFLSRTLKDIELTKIELTKVITIWILSNGLHRYIIGHP